MPLDITVTNRFEEKDKKVVVKKNGEVVCTLEEPRKECTQSLAGGESLTIGEEFVTPLPDTKLHFYVAYSTGLSDYVTFDAIGDPIEGPIPNFPKPGYTGYKDSECENPRCTLVVTNTTALADVDGSGNVLVGDDDQ